METLRALSITQMIEHMSKYKNDAKTVRDEPERPFLFEGKRDIKANSFSQHGNDDDCSDHLHLKGRSIHNQHCSQGVYSRQPFKQSQSEYKQARAKARELSLALLPSHLLWYTMSTATHSTR